MNSAAFDAAARNYDSVFTDTAVGRAQRSQVWKYVESLNISHKASVFEVNCGTGEDAARWQKRGNQITASDISGEMVLTAKSKYPEIEFVQQDMCVRPTGKYNVVFSNFGGLNCLNAEEGRQFFSVMHDCLHEDGRLILVVMGRKCIWDVFFQLIKGQFQTIFRRSKRNGIAVNVDGEVVTTHYYSPRDLRRWSASLFETETTKPVGLFVPPSYLAAFSSRNRRFFSVLKSLDNRMTFPFLSDYADHYFISLKKSSRA